MRHLKSGRRLGLNAAHRKALLRNLVTSLMEHGRIETTEARAKELRRVAERIITLSRRVVPSQVEVVAEEKRSELLVRRVHAIRQARRWITDRDILTKIFSEYSERYAQRPGGYTRIYKLGRRPGDQAPTVLIELVTEAYPPPPAEKAPEAAPAAESAESAS